MTICPGTKMRVCVEHMQFFCIEREKDILRENFGLFTSQVYFCRMLICTLAWIYNIHKIINLCNSSCQTQEISYNSFK